LLKPLNKMLRFGFAQLCLRRIADGCAVENVASARVMEKCGLRLVGERDGERLYALTASEWRESHNVIREPIQP
jgi:RimJ/RimL family protein N-acetyltransferase